MNEVEITSLDLVEGANVVKQGHYLTLGYVPRDQYGKTVDLTGKNIAVAIYSQKKIIYETTAVFSGGLLRFNLDATIDSGNVMVEFTATSPIDPKYRQKFPTNRNEGRLTIERSSDDLDFFGVSVTTAEKIISEQTERQMAFEAKIDPRIETLQQRVDEGIGAFTEDTEVLDARMGEENLRAFNEKTAEQLAVSRTAVLNKEFVKKAGTAILGEIVSRPAWFTWNAPITIYEKDGLYSTDFDVAMFEPINTGVVYYVDPINGDNTRDGLTRATALKSVYVAVQKGNAGVIWISTGIIKRTEMPSTVPDRNLSIKALPGAKVVLSNHDDLAWTLVSGKTKTYQATRSSVDWVWDAKNQDANGDHLKLTLRSTIDEVEANPGSYYINGSTVYVHTHDSRSLIGDTDIRAYLSTVGFEHIGGRTFYFENISFEGGRWRVFNSATGLNPLVLAKECAWKYMAGNQQGGFELVGGDAYLQKCIASSNLADGFNYHIGNGVKNRVIEVECMGFRNGNRLVAIHSDNGSTMHDGGQIIRLNGAYFENEGPNVADVSDGTQSWNLGCVGVKSRSAINGGDFRARGLVQMQLDGCVTNNANAIIAEEGATIVSKNVISEAEISGTAPLTLQIPAKVAASLRMLEASIESVEGEFSPILTDLKDIRTKTIRSSGVNANGTFVRFEDGTQFAYTNAISLAGEAFIAEGALFRSSNVFTPTLPAEFVGEYSMIPTARRTGGVSVDNRAWAVLQSKNSFVLYKVNGNAMTDAYYMATVIGRWK